LAVKNFLLTREPFTIATKSGIRQNMVSSLPLDYAQSPEDNEWLLTLDTGSASSTRERKERLRSYLRSPKAKDRPHSSKSAHKHLAAATERRGLGNAMSNGNREEARRPSSQEERARKYAQEYESLRTDEQKRKALETMYQVGQHRISNESGDADKTSAFISIRRRQSLLSLGGSGKESAATRPER